MIEFQNVSKSYADILAIDSLSLRVQRGEFLVLIGPSGSGKSTALKLINRMLDHDQGRILLDGQEIYSFDVRDLRRRMGYAIQSVGLFPHWTVARNIGTVPQLLGWHPDRIAQRVNELLAFHDKQRFASAASVDEFRSNMLKPGAVYSALAVVRGMDYAPDQVRYRDIGLPSVIIWGEEDRVTPLDAGKQLAGLVDSARLEVLTACGHVPLWERPQAVVRIIEEHLADIEGTRRKRPRSDATSTPNAGVAMNSTR